VGRSDLDHSALDEAVGSTLLGLGRGLVLVVLEGGGEVFGGGLFVGLELDSGARSGCLYLGLGGWVSVGLTLGESL